MASAKRVAQWFEDLRQGTAKKREAAARNLASSDAVAVRSILLEAFAAATKVKARRVIGRCLHYVADVGVARLLVADADLELQPARLSTAVRLVLHDDLRVALPSLSPEEVSDRLSRLGLIGGEQVLYSIASDGGLLSLLLAVLDDPRLATLGDAVTETLNHLDQPSASEALLGRWEAESPSVSALAAYVAWVRLGCPSARPAATDRFHEALVADLDAQRPGAGGEGDDRLLARGAPRIPPRFVLPLMIAFARNEAFPETTAAVARRLVEITPPSELASLFEDVRLEPCREQAAEALVDGGAHGARFVLERWAQPPRSVHARALTKLPADEAYAFVAQHITEEAWYDVVASESSLLRDPRFIELAGSRGLPDRGRAMLVTMGRDIDNPSRGVAVAALASAATRAVERLEKRHALHALGQTGHPDATPPLLAALDDPELGDGGLLVCMALGECADTRAIPVLEKRPPDRHSAFVDFAVKAIQARAKQIHTDVLVAACQDADPVIADLARRARNNDADAVVVLEDALRERGRL
jgi:hypothetical protein